MLNAFFAAIKISADVSMTYLGDEVVSGTTSTLTATTRTVAGLGSGVTVNVQMTASGGTDGGCSYKKNADLYVFVDVVSGPIDFTLTNGDTLTLRGNKGTDSSPVSSSCSVVNLSNSSALIASGSFSFT